MTSDLRCPACTARVREGAPWCTQCYAGLAYERAAVVEAPVEPPPPRVPAPRAADAALPELHGTAAPSWPCTGCAAPVPLDLSACPHCGQPFLRAERPSLVLPGVGDLAALPRGQRLVLAVLVVLLVLGVTAVLAAG